jgi:hypothetical protein
VAPVEGAAKTPPAPGATGDLIGGEPAKEAPVVDAKSYEIAPPDDLKDYVKGVETYAAKALELKISPEAYKGLLDHHFAQMREQLKGVKEVQEKKFSETVNGWKAEVANDPEIGGVKLAESSQLATKGALALGGQALVDELRKTGLSNWPPLVRAMRNAGMKISDDAIGGSGNSGVKPDPTEDEVAAERDRKMFPSHYK